MSQATAETLFGLTLLVCALPKRARILCGIVLLVEAVAHSNGWWA